MGGLTIRPVEDLLAIAGEHDALIGVICTPAPAAQAVADAMVLAGLRSILNFAPVALMLYLAALPAPDRAALDHVRATVRAAAPDATEGIGYGIPVFRWQGSLIGYGAILTRFFITLGPLKIHGPFAQPSWN